MLVLLAAWTTLRFGELSELRRSDVDLDAGVLKVSRAVSRTDAGLEAGPPKSEAGIRTVAVPGFLLPGLAAHLAAHLGDQLAVVGGFDLGEGATERKTPGKRTAVPILDRGE